MFSEKSGAIADDLHDPKRDSLNEVVGRHRRVVAKFVARTAEDHPIADDVLATPSAREYVVDL